MAAAGEPVRIETIEVQSPAAGEVLVRIQASGVCRTDLHAQRGHFGRQFPYLLGHEAVGVVERVGEGVTRPAVGDRVMLSWRAPCGHCGFCDAGKSNFCKRPLVAGKRMHTQDGKVLGRVLGLGTFCSHTVVHAAQAIVIDAALPATAMCLVGCGVVTGVGAVLFSAKVEAGARVAVFGCGAVGISVVQGARLARAGRIIAVDRVPQKLAWAKEFGATDVIDARDGDVVKAIKQLCGGVDHAFEAIGLPETLEQALECCALAGRCTLIGVPQPGAKMTVDMAKLFYARRTLSTTFYGDCLPARDFPLLAQWYARGDLMLDEMVTQRIALEQLPEAFEAMERGETLRSVIVWPEEAGAAKLPS